MTAKDLSALRHLWQEAFDEPEDFTDLFFSVGFSAYACNFCLISVAIWGFSDKAESKYSAFCIAHKARACTPSFASGVPHVGQSKK